MKNDTPTEGSDPAKALIKALGENEHARMLVDECAAELSSSNDVLKHELSDSPSCAGIKNALKKSEAVESKVQEVSTTLSGVNHALKHEVLERQVLAHQLADVMAQEAVSHHAAFHDSLTGLPNRALFNDRLQHGLMQAKRHGWNLSVMFVDLDDFKIVNDAHGHHVGDHLLKTVAARLRQVTRIDDTICRHGGDEFLCLLMEAPDEKSVALIAEKIIQAIQAPDDSRVGTTNVCPQIKASVGIAMFPRDGTTAEALIQKADIAMYRAKQNKSGYSFASAATNLQS